MLEEGRQQLEVEEEEEKRTRRWAREVHSTSGKNRCLEITDSYTS